MFLFNFPTTALNDKQIDENQFLRYNRAKKLVNILTICKYMGNMDKFSTESLNTLTGAMESLSLKSIDRISRNVRGRIFLFLAAIGMITIQGCKKENMPAEFRDFPTDGITTVEDLPEGSEVYQFQAIDPDGETVEFSLQKDNEYFELTPDGKLLVKKMVDVDQLVDKELETVLSISAFDTEGAGETKDALVRITDNPSDNYPENLPPVANDLTANIQADVLASNPIANLSNGANDPDGNITGFQIVSTSPQFNHYFEVQLETGEVSQTAAVSEGTHTLSFVAIDDSNAVSNQATLTINAFDNPPQNEAPTASNLNITLTNGPISGSPVAELSGSTNDPDGNIVEYELINPSISFNGNFTLNTATGAVNQITDLSGYPEMTYTTSYRVKDNDGEWSAPAVLNITTENPMIPPVISGPSMGAVDENQTGTVASFTSNVPGTWSLQNESTPGIFQLSSPNGTSVDLLLIQAQNYENGALNHTVDLVCTAPGGQNIVGFTLTENNVLEPFQTTLSPQDAINMGYDIDAGTLGGEFPFSNAQGVTEHFWQAVAQMPDEGATVPTSVELKSTLSGLNNAQLLTQLQNNPGYNGAVFNIINAMIGNGYQISYYYDSVSQTNVLVSAVTGQEIPVVEISRTMGVIADKVGSSQGTTYTGTSPWYSGDLNTALYDLGKMLQDGNIATDLHLMAEGAAQKAIDLLNP